MPIISTVGRKQRRLRALIAALYVILCVGAVTMVYPFLLMVSTSFTSPVDQNEFRIIPSYFRDDASLYRKYIESKYNESIPVYNVQHSTDYAKFEDIEPPARINREFVREWREFRAGLPERYLMIAHTFSIVQMTSETVYKFRMYAKEKFGGDLALLNKTYLETNENWSEVGIPIEDLTLRNFMPNDNPKYRDMLRFKESLPDRYLVTVSGEGLYQESLRLTCGKIDAINEALGTNYAARSEVRLSSRVPPPPAQDNWEAFVRKECPVRFVRVLPEAAPRYRDFIRRKYQSIEPYNQAYEVQAASFDSISMPPDSPQRGIPLSDWIQFMESEAPAEALELRTPEILFRQHLVAKFGDIREINEHLGTDFASIEELSPPWAENDALELIENEREIRREFIVRNYREVLDYMLLHGRAMLNTTILCIAMVVATLTVNPLCAYALSRFNLRSTYKILLFLLATMAFPAEVSAIPSFLLIKDLHLLGTYWAIILPGLASGYSIFLLKGFFDSLPRELYEAAIMDGATEMQMYRKITLQLSKPVLAVIALGAFTAAYGSFMWAFLVLQNPKMWTLMVWLYQMQQWAPQSLVYAGLVLTAIPTLLVFIFCQNIIMRGIIIPSEK